jgi:hypothetical protein
VPISAVGLALLRPPLRDRRSKILKHGNSALPVDASIGDGDTLLEAAGTLRRDLLVALVDVGLDHDAADAGFAVTDLVGDVFRYDGLVAVVFAGVAYCSLVLILYSLLK